ncbi:MAG: (Fe-S)-binding protein [bacterium]|nr:(Fe-S)-binding protein [bacterium]
MASLLFLGCTLRFGLPDLADKYRQVLDELGIDYLLAENEPCCGLPLYNAGLFDEFKEHCKKVKEILRAKKMIFVCPSCCYTFKYIYPKFVEKWKVQAVHVIELLTELLHKKKFGLEAVLQEKQVGFHDPCHLGRGLGIYEQPRELLRAAGYNVLEPVLAKQYSFCCGGGGGLRATFPESSLAAAKLSLERFAKLGCKVVVTSCPMCLLQLREAASQHFPEIKVVDILEAIKVKKR